MSEKKSAPEKSSSRRLAGKETAATPAASPVEADSLTHAFNIAQQCLNMVGKYLAVSDAPAVRRAAPEFKSAVLNNLHAYGYQQILRAPLQSIIEQAKLPPIEVLSRLKAVDQSLVNEWDAWSNNISEVVVYIAKDLWKEVECCEREFGLDATWGQHGVVDGLLYDRLGEEWRFNDIPLDRFSRCQHEELLAWRTLPQKDDPPPRAPTGRRGRQADPMNKRRAERANELRSQVPQVPWKDVARKINEDPELQADKAYSRKSIHSLWRHFYPHEKKS